VIKQLNITDEKDLPIDYWDNIPSLKGLKEFNFSPDITLIIGPNASGKSTLLNLLKIAFHCTEGYYSCLTRKSIENNTKRSDEDCEYHGYNIIHDGNPVFLFNPSSCKERTHFDDDFMMDQISHMVSTKTASSGQKSFYSLSAACTYASKIDTIKDKLNSLDNVNDYWKKVINAGKNIINNPSIPKSKKTIILDEPTQFMDFINEMEYWEQMEIGTRKYQFIIATHSIGVLKNFSCDIKIIELKDGFLDDIKKSFELLK